MNTVEGVEEKGKKICSIVFGHQHGGIGCQNLQELEMLLRDVGFGFDSFSVKFLQFYS